MSSHHGCSDLMRARDVLDWSNLLLYLSRNYPQFEDGTSTSSISVTYGGLPRLNSANPEDNGPLLLNTTASLDRAAELVAVMPENARNMLLAPIRHGLLDLQSVFYLKDVTRNEHIAISVEDFLRLVSCYFVNSTDEQDIAIFGNEALDIDMTDPNIPSRLLAALSHILEGENALTNGNINDYSSVTSFNSISSSTQSWDHCSHHPPIPISRPPAIAVTQASTCSSSSRRLNSDFMSCFGKISANNRLRMDRRTWNIVQLGVGFMFMFSGFNSQSFMGKVVLDNVTLEMGSPDKHAGYSRYGYGL